MSSPDPFSARFDSIAVDPANAPSAEAIDRALAFVAPAAAGPEAARAGFYLMNDAGGRFVVDRDLGVITVASEATLTRDAGQTYNVRLKVIEASGAHYELDMALKITGLVPQMIGAEDFSAIAGITADVAPLPAVVVIAPTPWARFAATNCTGAAERLGDERAVFGSLLATDLSRSHAAKATLTLGATPPAPASARATWEI